MKIGILGGTFNPPHLGHLTAAQNARAYLGLDRVLFIPTNLPPHKALPADSASTTDRCEMVRLMTEPLSWAALDTIEVDGGGTSYTIDTLRALHKREAASYYLIIGTDMLLGFDKVWRAPDEIAQLATLAVCAREADDRQELEEKAALLRKTLGATIVLIPGEVMEISSTELRRKGDLRRFTAPAVANYIENKHLYHF